MEPVTYGYVVVAVLGLVMGSFAGATVWRLRARQLLQDKKAGEPYDKAELKRLTPLTKSNLANDRSRCLHCGHTLAWYDLLPLTSWLSTKGKCRYCNKPIGSFEPLIELGTAASFVLFYAYWINIFGPTVLWLLGLWLVAIVLLVILFAYDAKWFLLPDVITYPLIGISAVIAIIQINLFNIGASDLTGPLLSLAGSVLILSGLYLVLWLVSKGTWVGFGDVKLGLALGLLLLDWRLAFLTLFLANFIGVLVVLPGLISKKLSRGSQVPFGPFMIAGFAISLLAGGWLVSLFEQIIV